MAIPSRTFDSIEGNEREREGEGNSGCDLMVAEGDPRLQPEGLARIHSHISGPWLIVGTKQASGMWSAVRSSALHRATQMATKSGADGKREPTRPRKGTNYSPFRADHFRISREKVLDTRTCSLRARGFRAFAIFRWIGARIGVWLHERGKVVSGIIYKLIIKNSAIEIFV